MQRILVLSGIFGVLTFGILFCKLWQLQVVQHEKLENKAITQQTREISSTANRGTIYDANGDILAISGSVQNVILSPRDVLATVKVDEKDEFGNARSKTAIEAEKETKVQATYDLIADEMSEILGLDREDVMARLKKTKSAYEVLAEKVEEYRATEDAMRSTLLSAQRMAAQMVSDAQAQRDKMLSDAQEEANRQVAQLEQQVAQAQHKLTMAQNSLSDFLRRRADLCAQQVSFLRSLPEAEVEEGQPVTLPAPEEGRVPVADAAEEPAAPVEEAPAEEAEAPAEEPAPQEAPAEEPAKTESPFSAGFNLDDLKFGRNYNSEH